MNLYSPSLEQCKEYQNQIEETISIVNHLKNNPYIIKHNLFENEIMKSDSFLSECFHILPKSSVQYDIFEYKKVAIKKALEVANIILKIDKFILSK